MLDNLTLIVKRKLSMKKIINFNLIQLYCRNNKNKNFIEIKK